MLAAAPGLLVDLGAVCGALLAFAGLCALLGRSRPVRWVGRTLIADPLAKWFRAQVAHEFEPRMASVEGRIAAVEAQLKPNGGSSAYDKLTDRLDSVERGQRKIFARLPGDGSLADEDDPDPDDPTT